jgi:putative lipoic acid-binding regulatory protein
MSDQMSGEHRESMQFPCEIAVRAMGRADSDLETIVVEIVRRHVPDLGEGSVSSKPSSKGNYLSVTVRVNAVSRAQMDALYEELSAHEAVAMAL